MLCILCLEAKESIPFLTFDEAVSLDVKNILLQHFCNIQPEENDIVCKECWNYVYEFHKFYLRVEQVHQSGQQVEIFFNKETLLGVLKDTVNSVEQETVLCELEESSELLESSADCKESIALDDPIGANDKKDALEKIEENSILHEPSVPLKESRIAQNQIDATDLEDAFIKNELSKKGRKYCTRNSSLQEIHANTESANKTDNELSVLKKRRGRPTTKSRDLQTKKEKVSLKLKRAQRVLSKRTDKNLIKDETTTLLNKKSKEGQPEKLFSRRDLSQYDDFISENMKLSCDVCKEDCTNFRNLQAHFRNKHKMRGYVKCCGLKLLKRGVLLDHLQIHRDPGYFKCTKCGKVLSNRRCLELHNRNHQEKGEPKFKCEICSKAFHLRRVCKLHMESHVPVEERQFQCEHCAKRFTSAYLLNNHVRRRHLNKYSRICDVCGKKIIGSEAFRTHQEQHKGIQPATINCEICGVRVKTKYDLTRHKKEKHTEEFQAPQKCEFCLKILANLMALKRHIKYMHSLQRTHKCSMCEKSFKRAVDLKEHFTTHMNQAGGGLYICTFCPRTFNSSANMYNHRKRMHPEEWARIRKEKDSKQNTVSNLEAELNMILEEK